MVTPTSGNIATKTTKKSKTNLKGFTKVLNSILNNKTLSLEEKGLLSILISNSKEWKVFITEIYKRSTNSELIQRANNIKSKDKPILTKRANKHIYNSAEKKELVQENKYTITKKEPAIENNVIRTEEYIWNEVTTQNPPEIISSLSFVERNILFNKIIFDIETKETRLNTNERQTIIADIKVYFNLNSTEGEVILIQ